MAHETEEEAGGLAKRYLCGRAQYKQGMQANRGGGDSDGGIGFSAIAGGRQWL